MNEVLEERNFYNMLISQKNEGKIFTKEDLDYESLYQLSVVENVNDSLIGDIFGLKKTQVNYQRKKHNLSNVFLKRMISCPELFNKYLEINNLEKTPYIEKIFLESLKIYAKGEGWNPNLVDEYYMEEQLKKQDLFKEDLNDYDIEITSSNIIQSISKTKSKIKGQKTNQLKNNISKYESGKLGEEIAFITEKRKLNKKNLPHLSNQVKWVTKTDDKNITNDGLGYDIISYNEYGEKIYIEVKCSQTTTKNYISFNITSKEIELMNGNLPGIDKKHAFIYYVYSIDKKGKKAKIEIIDSEKFQNLLLQPTIYKVTGKLN